MRVVAAVALLMIVGTVPAGAEEPTDLEWVVARIGEEASAFDPGAIIGISVIRIDTGEHADHEGDRWLKAASSLKPTWVAAAIREAGLDAVAPYAQGIWVQSSNRTGGIVIGLAGGLDPVNAFTRGLGMHSTLVVEWTPGGEWRSSEYPGPHPALNFTTADDLVGFWRLLDAGQVLDPEETEAVLEWARMPRQPGYPSGLLTRIPDRLLVDATYKMGWLPPGRTEEDEETGEVVEVDALDTLVGSGIVEGRHGQRYVVGVGSFGGSSWPGKVSFVAYAGCRIHEAIIEVEIGCDRSGDPRRTRLDTDPPTGALIAVGGSTEFVDVAGWAVDPDDHRGTIRVGFTIDGIWAGATRAGDEHSFGASPRQASAGHGFSATLLAGLSPGTHEVCAIAFNDGSGRHTDIGCRSFAVDG